MLFILKRKRKKENVGNKNTAHEPILHQTGKEKRERWKIPEGGPVSEELYL